MTIWEFVGGVTASMFGIYMLLDLESSILPQKNISKRDRYIVFLGLSTTMFLGDIWGSSIVNLVFVPTLYIIESLILFSGTRLKRIGIAIIYYMMGILPEFIFGMLLRIDNKVQLVNMPINIVDQMMLIFIMRMLTFIMIQFVKKIQNKQSYTMVQNKMFAVLMVLPISTIIILVSIFYSDIGIDVYNKALLVLVTCLLTVSNVSMFYVFNRLVLYKKETEDLKAEYIRSELQSKHYEALEEVNQKHKNILHDIKKLMRTAVVLIKRNELNTVLALFEEVEGDIEKAGGKVYSSHKILNAILCEQGARAEAKNIQYIVDLQMNLDVSFISNIDLISILGNLLDNAIEATEELGSKGIVKVRMYMHNDNPLVILEVENNYIAQPKMEEGHFFTRKIDKQKHGLGIVLIEKAVERYGGKLNIHISDENFLVITILSQQ